MQYRQHICQCPSFRLGGKKNDSYESQHIGISKGGKTTKIHALVDALGYPVKILLSAGNINDITVAPQLIEELNLMNSVVMADKAYASTKFINQIKEHYGIICIPCSNSFVERWEIDRWQYRERHSVECYFKLLKDCRRIATRYEKLSRRFLAFIHFASILIWLK